MAPPFHSGHTTNSGTGDDERDDTETQTRKRKGTNTMDRFLPYELAQARQRKLLCEAEMDRLAAGARMRKSSLSDVLLAHVGRLLVAAGSRVERRAQRPREAAAGTR